MFNFYNSVCHAAILKGHDVAEFKRPVPVTWKGKKQAQDYTDLEKTTDSVALDT